LNTVETIIRVGGNISAICSAVSFIDDGVWIGCARMGSTEVSLKILETILETTGNIFSAGWFLLEGCLMGKESSKYYQYDKYIIWASSVSVSERIRPEHSAPLPSAKKAL
jgi:hypothetical protein